MQTGKEELKVSRFADDMMLYINDTKNSTGKLLKLINTFIKSIGTKLTHKNQ